MSGSVCYQKIGVCSPAVPSVLSSQVPCNRLLRWAQLGVALFLVWTVSVLMIALSLSLSLLANVDFDFLGK